MKKIISGLAGVVILIIAISTLVSRASATPLLIMPLGDSITEGGYTINGQYFSEGGGYRLNLGKLLSQAGFSFDFVGSLENGPLDMPNRHHEGHSGWRIDQLLVQTASWLKLAHPDTILLHIGTNDVVQNHDLPGAPKRFEELLDLIRTTAPTAELYVSTIIGTNNDFFNFKINSYNNSIFQIIRQKSVSDSKIHFVDMYNDSGILTGSDGGPSDLTDGVHPTAQGYIKMSRVWFTALMASHEKNQDHLAPSPK